MRGDFLRGKQLPRGRPGAFQHGVLDDGVAELAVDVDQRGLAVLIDPLEIGLQQRTAARSEQPG